MPQFRLENNVPNVYVDESRDFQLLCRLLDVYLDGCKGSASYIKYQREISTCSEQLLYAIANMQGFTTNMYIPPNVLRNILEVFPYCIKRKGTREAIRVAAYAVLSADRLIYDIIVNTYADNDGFNYYVEILCNTRSEYLPYLTEVLRFIVPAGWKTVYRLLNQVEVNDSTSIHMESKAYKLSGITARIVGANNVIADMESMKKRPNVEEQDELILNKTYSKINYAKIIKSRTLGEFGPTGSGLLGQQGYYLGPSGATNVNLINDGTMSPNGQTGSMVFIYHSANSGGNNSNE